MTRFGLRQLLMLRIILGAIGVAIWGYGYRTDDPNIRLVGMAVLVAVLLMSTWAPSDSTPVTKALSSPWRRSAKPAGSRTSAVVASTSP
jgi:hypothetical protein